MRTSACKGCGKPIVWATLRDAHVITSKRIPLDPKPPVYHVICDEKGEIPTPGEGELVLCERSHGPVVRSFVSHFATCPNANDFSGSKSK